MTPLEALRSATIEAATLLGVQDRLGSIEPGKLADVDHHRRRSLEGHPRSSGYQARDEGRRRLPERPAALSGPGPSEHEFENKLNQPRAPCSACLLDVIEPRASYEGVVQPQPGIDGEEIRRGELRVVEQVEEVRLELELTRAAHLEGLRHHEIDIVDSWCAEAIALGCRHRTDASLNELCVGIVGEVAHHGAGRVRDGR